MEKRDDLKGTTNALGLYKLFLDGGNPELADAYYQFAEKNDVTPSFQENKDGYLATLDRWLRDRIALHLAQGQLEDPFGAFDEFCRKCANGWIDPWVVPFTSLH